MGCLLEILGVERGAETQSDTGAELDVVSESGDTLVVDLGLCPLLAYIAPWNIRRRTLAKEVGSNLYLVATSRPTFDPAFESQVAFAPASTSVLTL